MKKIRKAKEIREEIGKRYDKEPEGWRVFAGRDSENYLHSLFLQDENFWLIKEFPLNPYQSVGVGAKEKARDTEIKKFKTLTEFGLRPLLPQQIETLLKGNSSVIDEILKNQPLSSERCRPFPAILEGPVSILPGSEFISKKQEKLDRKLRKSLRNLLNREYPEITRIYR